MQDGAVELLRRLAGRAGTTRADDPVAARASARPDSFDDRLSLALAGSLRTGLPVRVPIGMPGLDSGVVLDALAEAADLAQLEGIRRALVMFAGRTIRLDVERRAVVDEPDPKLGAITGVDGVLRIDAPASGRGGADARGRAAPGPARVVRNASLIDALADVSPGV